jgi:hypothetical protein
MIGTFAAYGHHLYFNEVSQKPNLASCDLPIEAWRYQKHAELIYPLSSHAIAIKNYSGKDDRVEVYPAAMDLPRIAAISIRMNGRIEEIGLSSKREALWRRIPTGPGVIYTRAVFSDYEDTLYAALKLTGNLREGVDLANRSSITVAGLPIFTTVGVAAYAVLSGDLGALRTMSSLQAAEVLLRSIKLVANAPVTCEKEKAAQAKVVGWSKIVIALLLKELTVEQAVYYKGLQDKMIIDLGKKSATVKTTRPRRSAANA